MAYTEFCCRSGGSNLNAGTRTGNSTEPGTTASFTYASGSWVNSTGVFTVASGNPSTDGVAAGDFASVYANGSTVTGFVGRVTAVSSTTITVSSTAIAGTKPADGTSTRTLKIGGAWKGPNGAEAFPFNFAANTLTNSAGDTCRVNFKNDAAYSITATITHGVSGPVYWQGYTTSYGDLGKAIIDGGTTGASYILMSTSGVGVVYMLVVDFIFQNNGATGAAYGVDAFGDPRTGMLRCVIRNIRGSGSNQVGTMVECEVYGINQSNTADLRAVWVGTTTSCLIRCFIHHNAGTFTHGIYVSSGATLIDCVVANNGGIGIFSENTNGCRIIGCDVYNNGLSGLRHHTSAAWFYIENCNFINNTGYGIDINTGSARGFLSNCGFGGNTTAASNNLSFMSEVGTVTYTGGQTPWVDPANGDFRINHASAKGTGRAKFTQVYPSWSAPNTVGYPDIGAAQHQDAGGAVFIQPTYGLGM